MQALSTIFNAEEYALYYPDVVEELGEYPQALFNHFITFGIWEQRQPCHAFNVDVYASRNPDLQALYGDDIVAYYMHYVNYGRYENRPVPTKANAYIYQCTLYSVYDFVKGQTGPRAGAIPIQTINWRPEVQLETDGQ